MAVSAVPKVAVALGEKLSAIILDRLNNGRLVLPVMPEVAQRAITTLRDPEFHQQKVVSIIGSDPLLAALVMRNANAAVHGTAARGLDQAVSRLGQQKLKSNVVEYMAKEVFRSTQPRIAAATKNVWKHSLAVAHLARDLAAFVGDVDGGGGEVAYLAGLLHDIGKPVVAAILLDIERQSDTASRAKTAASIDDTVFTHTVESMHRPIGIAIATKWKMPEEVISGVRDCSDFDGGDRKSIANIVRFANALAKREGYAAGPVDMPDVEALIMVGRSMLGADDALINKLTGGLSERLAEK